MSEMAEAIATKYDLDGFTADRLVFRYDHYPGEENRPKVLSGSDRIGRKTIVPAPGKAPRPLTLADLQLKVMMKPGDEADEDFSCDSDFMDETIPEVGQAIRDKFHWVDDDEIIYQHMGALVEGARPDHRRRGRQ